MIVRGLCLLCPDFLRAIRLLFALLLLLLLRSLFVCAVKCRRVLAREGRLLKEVVDLVLVRGSAVGIGSDIPVDIPLEIEPADIPRIPPRPSLKETDTGTDRIFRDYAVAQKKKRQTGYSANPF